MKEARVFTSEAEFREWFERNPAVVGVGRIILSQEPCPDYVLEMQDGRVLRVEAELFAVNFKYHRHDPSKVDLVLACYSKTDRVAGVPVIAINKLWRSEAETAVTTSSDTPLSCDEADLLAAVHASGGMSIAALALHGFSGDQALFVRLPPEVMATFPRGKITDHLLNILSPSAKEFLKKYHHVLVAGGLSVAACESIESLMRRGLVKYRPLDFLSAVYDGAIAHHPGWIPAEIYATPKAWEDHKDVISSRKFPARRRGSPS